MNAWGQGAGRRVTPHVHSDVIPCAVVLKVHQHHRENNTFVLDITAMPGLAKKLLVFAAIDGLFLQPIGPGGKSVKIDYGFSNKITSSATKAGEDGEEGAGGGFEVHGVIGIT